MLWVYEVPQELGKRKETKIPKKSFENEKRGCVTRRKAKKERSLSTKGMWP